VQLVEWQRRQPAPGSDDDSPPSEFDRLIAILAEHTGQLSRETERQLGRAWGVVYRLAWLPAEDTCKKQWAEQHAARVAAMERALTKLLDALEMVGEAWGDFLPAKDGPNSEAEEAPPAA
jgi:hypothetical protein